MAPELADAELVANTIRTLSIDAIQRANSGHPGAPMGLAPVGWSIFSRHLRHSPANPAWPGRDRFVLSAGHASMLLYSLLHLSGYALPLEELRAFRQLGSETPGHPERGDTPGVEVTTGPLGQGVGNAVGLAIAERMLAARFNRPGHEIVDHRTWFICSDGDLMAGISYEAAPIAGHLGLEKLVGVYRVLLPHLLAVYTFHQHVTSDIVDAPTVRLLKFILDDDHTQLVEAEMLIQDLARTAALRRRAGEWQTHLDVLLAESGGVCGPTTLLSEAKIAKPGPAVLGAALRDKREAAVGVR